jgi:hypothetical protein
MDIGLTHYGVVYKLPEPNTGGTPLALLTDSCSFHDSAGGRNQSKKPTKLCKSAEDADKALNTWDFSGIRRDL